MKNIKTSLTLKSFLTAGMIAGALIVSASPLVASAQTLTRQLQQGMSGSDVSLLQTFLAKDKTIYPQGLVTGYYGTLTTSAVSNFQSRNGISTVGRVGPATLAVINQQMNADVVSPTIYPVSVSVSSNAVSMNWNTSENASSVIYYGTSPLSMIEGSATSPVTIGGSSILVHSDLRSSHTANISSLNSNTTYYYVVYVRDGFGNESVTWPATFTTNQ